MCSRCPTFDLDQKMGTLSVLARQSRGASMSLRYGANVPSVAPIVRTFRAGTQIFGQGDEVTGTYKVVSGAVRSCRYLGDGRRQVLGFHLVDDIFGIELGTEHSASAEAMGATVVAVMPGRSVARPVEFIDLFELATGQLQQAEALATDLGIKLAPERVASFLLDLSRRLHSTAFRMPMRRVDVADYLGLTVESISRVLNGFHKVGLIRIGTYKKRIELVDLRRLCELAEGRLNPINFDFHN
jgi:CRP/FNR family nitrogen fixation transcriptional regulator